MTTRLTLEEFKKYVVIVYELTLRKEELTLDGYKERIDLLKKEMKSKGYSSTNIHQVIKVGRVKAELSEDVKR